MEDGPSIEEFDSTSQQWTCGYQKKGQRPNQSKRGKCVKQNESKNMLESLSDSSSDGDETGEDAALYLFDDWHSNVSLM